MEGKWIPFRDFFFFKFEIIIFLRFQGWSSLYFCSCFIWVGAGLRGFATMLIREGSVSGWDISPNNRDWFAFFILGKEVSIDILFIFSLSLLASCPNYVRGLKKKTLYYQEFQPSTKSKQNSVMNPMYTSPGIGMIKTPPRFPIDHFKAKSTSLNKSFHLFHTVYFCTLAPLLDF